MVEHPDFDDADVQAEVVRLFERQRAIASLVSGNLDANTLLDLLDYQGFNPTEYVDCIEDNLNYVCPGLV